MNEKKGRCFSPSAQKLQALVSSITKSMKAVGTEMQGKKALQSIYKHLQFCWHFSYKCYISYAKEFPKCFYRNQGESYEDYFKASDLASVH
jgi:hypothetical protein